MAKLRKAKKMNDVLKSPSMLGKNLRLLRIAREMTLTDVARKVGISKTYLSLIEKGKRTIPFDLFYKLLQLYNYSLGQFISEAQHHSEDYGPYYEPASQIQTEHHHLLLAGDRSHSSPQLLQLRPLTTAEDIQMLLLSLPPHSILPNEIFFRLHSSLRGYVIEGNLLIEHPDYRELHVLAGSEFRIPENEMIRFRNYRKQDCKALLIIPYPWL